MTLARHIAAAPSLASASVSFREIWRLTWPQSLMMFFQFMVGLTDVWVAGQVHRDAQAVLGLVTQCQFILLLVGTATANASVAAMTQSLGAGLPLRANRYAGLILKLGFLCSFVAFALALALSRPILGIMQVPQAILPMAERFWQVYLLVLPASYVHVMTGAIFRARKAVFIPLVTSALAFGINFFASTGFGLGWWGLPALGTPGIAWATIVSVSAMALVNMIILVRRGFITRASFAPIKWDKRALPYLVSVAVPAGAMQLSWQLGYMVLFAVTGSLPRDSVNALAGMAAGLRVEAILFLPAVAFSMTGSMLVGHCLGAGNKQEAKRVGWRIILGGSGVMTLAAACLWPFLREMAAFIAPDPDAQAHALSYLRFNVLATPFSVISMSLAGILTGAGAAVYSFIVFGVAIWCVRLPLAWLFGHILWQTSSGVFMGMFISQIFQAIVLLYVFQTRDWFRFAMIKRHTDQEHAPNIPVRRRV